MVTAETAVLPGRTARVWLPGVAVVTAASVLVVWLARWGPDWPAQEFRAWIAGHDGLSVWTTRWYSGSALPGYSVLYPVLAGLIGPGTLGVLSCIAITWLSFGLAPRIDQRRAVLFGIGVAVSVTQNLLIGQVPFLLGAAFGVAALSALLSRRHPALIVVLSALASLSSPLAGTFLLLVAPAVASTRGWRSVLPLGGAAAGSLVALVVGGASGPFPCPWVTAASVAGFCVAVFVFVPRSQRGMQVFAACYLLADVLAFLTPNPVGGNIARLAKIIAIPLACYFLTADGRWRRAQTVAVAALALTWPTVAFTTSMMSGANDPSRAENYYSGIDGFLARQHWTSGRLEIPFTREHWESYFVARQFPIARGWERQSDLLYNKVLYHPLTASTYRAWLDENAVRMVALPRAPMDTGGRPEAALLRHPPNYLVPVWHDANWQVWRVTHPTALVSGPARLIHEGPSALTLRFTAPGRALVRIRASNLWVSDTRGSCLGSTPTGWLTVTSPAAGQVHLSARLTPAVLTGAADCG